MSDDTHAALNLSLIGKVDHGVFLYSFVPKTPAPRFDRYAQWRMPYHDAEGSVHSAR